MSTAVAPVLPAALRLGAVHLTVADLARAVAWYEQALGLHLHRREAERALLGDGTDGVIILHEDPGARRAGRTAGLYHYALLYPSRAELARAAVRLTAAKKRLTETRTQIQGASDHETHEALYLTDPDGNGIELAADRPRAAWPDHLGYAGAPKPLDLGALTATVADEEPAARVAKGLRVGHMHLYVGSVDDALGFYCDVIGFEVQANIGSAAFVSAGGYHHHLGVNVWNGVGVGPPAEHAVGLRAWTVELPSPADLDALRARLDAAGHAVEPIERGFLVRDPWGTAMTVVAAA
jgi:catechol 2,3-dioxygenase